MGVVATLCELVLPIGNSLGKYQRIGPFLADGPCKVRETDFVNSRVQHRVANLAEPHIHLPLPRTFLSVTIPTGSFTTNQRVSSARRSAGELRGRRSELSE